MLFCKLRPSAHASTHKLVIVSHSRCALTRLRISPWVQRWQLNPRRELVDARQIDLAGKSHRWLRRNRASPYTILYEAIEDRAPEILNTYADLVIENDQVIGHPRNQQPRYKPNEVNKAVLLLKPNSASIIAKVIRRPKLLSRATTTLTDRTSGQPVAESPENIAKLLFNERELYYMTKNGYTLHDLETWASLLLDPDCSSAISRLDHYMFAEAKTADGYQPRTVPVALLTALVNRRPLNGRSLQILLTCLWHVLRLRPYATARFPQYMKIFRTFTLTASQTWADCLPNLASLLIVFLPQSWRSGDHSSTTDSYSDLRDPFKPDENQRVVLNEAFNEAIELLSTSVGPNPYRNSIHQEKAQFMILSHMVRYDPPLQVDSQAFAGLIKVQLKRSKTEQEKQWYALQSRSWPPYPKPKTAMDEDKGYEYGSSRAVRTVAHMRQAGYSLSDWESISKIFAGWNTDQSPTIQTRVAYLSHHTAVHDMTFEGNTWAARIATTRDVREAWALFLQYETAQLPAFPLVYTQMFRKIVEESRRSEKDVARPDDSGITPGAYKEVVSPATSPMQRVFVSSEPPSFMELFNHMLAQHMEAPVWFTAFLIANAPSPTDALVIWTNTPHKYSRRSLIEAITEIPGPETGLPKSIFRGYIHLLCRHPWDISLTPHLGSATKNAIYDCLFQTLQSQVPGLFLSIHPMKATKDFAIWQALYFAKQHKATQPIVWQNLLRGILRVLYETTIANRPAAYWFFGPVNDILATMKELHIAIEVDFFDCLCQCVERIGRSAIRHLDRPDTAHRPSGYSDQAAASIISQGSMLIRKHFANLCSPTVDPVGLQRSTSGTSAENWIPRALTTPTPYTCQRYIRALAVFSDFEGLYSFARWLASHESDMVASMEHIPRASQQWTVVLTAFRVALESPHNMFYHFPSHRLGKPTPELKALIRATLEGMTELGGWATDEQVEDYGVYISMRAVMKKNAYTIGADFVKSS